MPHRRRRLPRLAFLGLLLLLTMSLQGCLAVMWVGLVGIDSARTSDIQFHPFENSWLNIPQEGQHLGLVRHLTVRPFIGDPMMTVRWTVVCQDLTSHFRAGTPLASQIGGVLTGYVISQAPENSFVGLKETSSQRLYLRLTSDSGILLWRTELPYTIVKGAKGLDEERVTNALLTHVTRHADEIGLSGLGAITVQATSTDLHFSRTAVVSSPN